MKATFHLYQARRIASRPLNRLRDRLRLSDAPLLRQSKWPVQSATQETMIRPFFIIGYPRSGTTLLRAILSRQDNVFIPPENGGLGGMISTFATRRTLPWETVVTAVLAEFKRGYAFCQWRIDLTTVQQAALSLSVEERSLAGLINLIYLHYGERHAPGKAHWGDKSVPGHAFHLSKIALVFPQARYIHLVRDGRDCVVSAIKAGFFNKNYSRAAKAWKDTVRECQRFRGTLSNHTAFFELRYEALVSAPEKEVTAVCSFLNLEPTDAMLRYTGETDHVADVLTRLHHANLVRPIFRDSIGNWRQQFPPAESESAMKIMQRELALFGYE